MKAKILLGLVVFFLALQAIRPAKNLSTVAPFTVRVWNRRKQGYDESGDRTYRIPVSKGAHGGADPRIMEEFLGFARNGGKTDTSPLAARESIATGCMATESLRAGGALRTVPKISPALARRFRT